MLSRAWGNRFLRGNYSRVVLRRLPVSSRLTCTAVSQETLSSVVPPVLEPRRQETEYLVSVGIPQSELRSSRAPSACWHSISFSLGAPFALLRGTSPKLSPVKLQPLAYPTESRRKICAGALAQGDLVSTSRAVFPPGGGAKGLRGRGGASAILAGSRGPSRGCGPSCPRVCLVRGASVVTQRNVRCPTR